MFFTLFFTLYGVGHYVVETIKTTLWTKENASNVSEREDANFTNHSNLRRYSLLDEEEDNKIKFTPVASVQRYRAVEKALRNSNRHIRKVVEFGCAGLKFAKNIKKVWSIEEAVFVDLDREVLDQNKFRIEPVFEDFDTLRENPLTMEIFEGSVTEYNSVLDDTDAVICIELIEHLHLPDVDKMEKNIFGNIQPQLVIITTPNQDFNVVFKMDKTQMRHWDHKFEWTRQEFQDWANSVIEHYPDYEVECETIVEGPAGTESLGGCSQIAIFTKTSISKSPVAVEHGVYKSVHEKQTYPYLTKDLIHESIQQFLSERETEMKSYGKDCHYFFNDKTLKKDKVQYDEIDFYEFKSNLRHKISNNGLFDVLDMFGIEYNKSRTGKMVIFPFVEGEVEFESEILEPEQSAEEEWWNDSNDEWNVDSQKVFAENQSTFLTTDETKFWNEASSFEEGDFDYVTAAIEDKPIPNDSEKDDNKKDENQEILANATDDAQQSSSLKRTNSTEVLNKLPSMFSFNLEKSNEGTQTSINASFPFLTENVTPIPKKPRLDLEGFSFQDAIQEYNAKNNITPFTVDFPAKSSTPKIGKADQDISTMTSDVISPVKPEFQMKLDVNH